MIPKELNGPQSVCHSPVRVVFGRGRLGTIGALARSEGTARVLMVTDPGIVAAGYARTAIASLEAAGLAVTVYEGVEENPTTDHVDRGVQLTKSAGVDLIIGLGGGSCLDCAKGINLILTNGGSLSDYRGEGRAVRPLLPMIAVPTTAGTGSEAQSFALISDPVSHEKMVCGDRRPPLEGGLRPRIAILDPELLASVPQRVAAAAGIDAVAHAIETTGSNARTSESLDCTRLAWTLLSNAIERTVESKANDDDRAAMIWGAHQAGMAIEHSMLGAAHACANPLTARYGVTHGLAVGLMLPHVIRYNAAHSPGNPYQPLCDDPFALANQVDGWLIAAGIPRRLSNHQVDRPRLPELAKMAAGQWTARFNPVSVDQDDLLKIYESAFA